MQPVESFVFKNKKRVFKIGRGVSVIPVKHVFSKKIKC